LVGLGVLTIAAAVVAALCSVLSGSLGNSMNRTRLLAVGCVGWGGASILIAWTNYWWVFCFSRLVVGASMAFVGPIQKGLLADLVVCAFRAIDPP
jgi:MFS family permease